MDVLHNFRVNNYLLIDCKKLLMKNIMNESNEISMSHLSYVLMPILFYSSIPLGLTI